jgi:hypothetical protein
MPDAVFSNIGKLLLATKIYRVAHYVSGGRCCASGCQVPEPLQRVDLPALESAAE